MSTVPDEGRGVAEPDQDSGVGCADGAVKTALFGISACRDWVMKGGNVGRDGQQSLLHLSEIFFHRGVFFRARNVWPLLKAEVSLQWDFVDAPRNDRKCTRSSC